MSKVSRRDFFRHSATLGMAAALAGPLLALLLGRRAGQGKMRLGLCTYLWGQDWDLPTILANCRKSGVLGVELRTEHKHGVEPTSSPRQRTEVKKRFAASPVIFVGIGTNECFDNPDPARCEQSIEAAKEVRPAEP